MNQEEPCRWPGFALVQLFLACSARLGLRCVRRDALAPHAEMILSWPKGAREADPLARGIRKEARRHMSQTAGPLAPTTEPAHG